MKNDNRQKAKEAAEKFNAAERAKAAVRVAGSVDPEPAHDALVEFHTRQPETNVSPRPGEAGPPFYATEYIFAGEAGNRTVVYVPVGGPIPETPAGARLVGTILKFPFESAEARAKAIG